MLGGRAETGESGYVSSPKPKKPTIQATTGTMDSFDDDIPF
jgi:hypothetical protein